MLGKRMQRRHFWSDEPPTPKFCYAASKVGAVKHLWPVGLLSPSPADRGQLIRNIPVLGGIDDIEDVVRDFAARKRPILRLVMAPSAFELEAHPEISLG